MARRSRRVQLRTIAVARPVSIFYGRAMSRFSLSLIALLALYFVLPAGEAAESDWIAAPQPPYPLISALTKASGRGSFAVDSEKGRKGQGSHDRTHQRERKDRCGRAHSHAGMATRSGKTEGVRHEQGAAGGNGIQTKRKRSRHRASGHVAGWTTPLGLVAARRDLLPFFRPLLLSERQRHRSSSVRLVSMVTRGGENSGELWLSAL